MNKRQLLALGVPEDCVRDAVAGIHAAAKAKMLKQRDPKKLIPDIVANPELFTSDEYFGDLAKSVAAAQLTAPSRQPVNFAQWGDDIDEASRAQMRNACRLPVAMSGALMPDAHVGYGLPIGGVLACDDAVVPYAVGVDIACRMRLTVTDLPTDRLARNDPQECESLDHALHHGTRFGVGKTWPTPQQHQVMDEDWTITRVTREVRDKAWRQLGTSGSGNHFVEWGVVDLPTPAL